MSSNNLQHTHLGRAPVQVVLRVPGSVALVIDYENGVSLPSAPWPL